MQTSKVMMGTSFLKRKSAALGSLCLAELHCSVLRTIALGWGLEGELYTSRKDVQVAKQNVK